MYNSNTCPVYGFTNAVCVGLPPPAGPPGGLPFISEPFSLLPSNPLPVFPFSAIETPISTLLFGSG
jgi:hypothetical protein